MSSNRVFFNLPEEIIFCKKCVVSNQRPASIPEFQHKRNREGAKYLYIHEDGICDACKHSEAKEKIDWEKREKEMKERDMRLMVSG